MGFCGSDVRVCVAAWSRTFLPRALPILYNDKGWESGDLGLRLQGVWQLGRKLPRGLSCSGHLFVKGDESSGFCIGVYLTKPVKGNTHRKGEKAVLACCCLPRGKCFGQGAGDWDQLHIDGERRQHQHPHHPHPHQHHSINQCSVPVLCPAALDQQCLATCEMTV